MHPQPLFFGRLLRILGGLIAFYLLYAHPPHGLLLQGLVLFLGISLIVGGVLAYAGCELLALPNLIFRKHLFCY